MSKLIVVLAAVVIVLSVIAPVSAQQSDLWFPITEGYSITNTAGHAWLNCSFGLRSGVDTQVVIDGVVHHVSMPDPYNTTIVSFIVKPGSTIVFHGIVAGNDSRYQLTDSLAGHTEQLKYSISLPLINR